MTITDDYVQQRLLQRYGVIVLEPELVLYNQFSTIYLVEVL